MHFRPLIFPCVISLLSTGCFSAAFAQEAAIDTFGDWKIICDDGAACRMSQTIGQTDTSRVIVQLRVFKGEAPTALLTFPLGILLSTGWSYEIDGGRNTVLPFEICNTSGCHAGLRLDADLLQRLKRGNHLTITFRDAANEPVMPVISLSGFTKAYEALE